MRPLVLAIAVVFAAAVPSAGQVAQGPAGGLRMLRGVVEADSAGALPLRRARVVVTAPGLSADPIFTDDRGRFEAYVPAARPFVLTVSKPGYVRREVPAASSTRELRVRLSKGAAVNGRVTDRFGNGLLRRIRIQRSGVELFTETDDLGEYRLGSLPAGEYKIGIVLSTTEPIVVRLTAGEDITVTHVEDVRETAARAGPVAADLGRFAGGGAGGTGQPDRGSIRGRVAFPDGEPIGGVVVRLWYVMRPASPRLAGAQLRTAMTGADGTYAVSGLIPADYRIEALKLESGLSQEEAARVITVRGGQVLEGIDITLRRGAAITGTVTDEHGEPLEGLTVQLWRRYIAGGRPRLVQADNVSSRLTDDRGRFRLFGVTPGTHYLVASDAARSSHVYYPGTPSITEAVPLHAAAGGDVVGIALVFAPRAAAIQGFAFDAAGRPLTAPVLLIDSYRSGVVTPTPRMVPVDANGAFSFANVPPGDYAIQGIVPGRRGRPDEFGMEYVTLTNGEAPPVVIRTRPGSVMSGRIVLEGDAAAATFSAFGLSAHPADWDRASIHTESPNEPVREDGTFEMVRLHGPQRITGSAPDGWWLKTVNIGVIDAADQPFTFGASSRVENVVAVFADTAATIAGTVKSEGGAEPPDYSVLLFPHDRSRWWARSGYVKLGRPDATGRFTIGTIPPGEYLVAAVETFDIASEWLDPEVLAALVPLARRITLPPDAVVEIDLELIRRSP